MMGLLSGNILHKTVVWTTIGGEGGWKVPINIPERYFADFRSAGRVQRFAAKESVFKQGDLATHLYLVTTGRVRAYTLSSDGQEITLEVLEAGRIFGDSSFLAGAYRAVTIQAVTDAEIVVCQTEKLLSLCQRSEELMVLLFQHMAETCNYLTHQVARLVHYDSRQKVADFLICESASRGQTQPGAVLPYSHEEIAHSVSLNRVTVSRILAEFRAKGMIDSRYRGVCILDRAALAAVLPTDS